VDLEDEVRPGATSVVLVAATLRARGVVEIAARIDDDKGNAHYETVTIQAASRSPNTAIQHTEQTPTQIAPTTYTVVVEKPYVHPVTYVAIAVAVVTAILALYLATRRR
jgi:carbohydrate-binding DOMON domain-containing protein